MIKTVSFAPPRASSPRSASAATPVAATRKTGGRAASGSPSNQTSLSFSFDEEPAAAPQPEPLPEPVKAKPVAKSPVQTETKAKPKTEVKPRIEVKPKTEVKAKAEPKVKAETKSKAETKPKATSNITFTKKAVPQSDKPKVELKGKKVRAPKDLAAQYGGVVAEERPNLPLILEPESPKKRLTKVQREARKVLMKPDEGLLERLARVSQLSAVKVKSEPRGKGWKFVCGRCGNTSYFQTPAGLCDCGAIALKD